MLPADCTAGYVRGREILEIISFLIFFPFVAAAVLFFLGNNEKVYPVRKFIVKGSGFLIMAAVVYLAFEELSGREHLGYLMESRLANLAVMAGEIFLMLLVTFYSFRYRKYYAAVLS